MLSKCTTCIRCVLCMNRSMSWRLCHKHALAHAYTHTITHAHTLFSKSIWYEIYTGIRKPKIQLKFSNQCDFIRWLHHIYMILEYNLNFIIWTISVVLFFFPSFDFFSSAAAADVTVAAIGIAGDSYVRAFFFLESIYLLKWYPFWANQAQKLSISYVSSVAWVYTANSRNVRKR